MSNSPDPLLHILYHQAWPYKVLAVQLVEQARSCRHQDGTFGLSVWVNAAEIADDFLAFLEDGPAGCYLSAAIRFIYKGKGRNTNGALARAFLSNPFVPLQILGYSLHPDWFDIGDPADPHDAGDYIQIEPQRTSLFTDEEYRSGPDWAAVFGYAVGYYWRQIPGLVEWLHQRAWKSGFLRAIGTACLTAHVPPPENEKPDPGSVLNDRRRWKDEGCVGDWVREDWAEISNQIQLYRDKKITVSELHWLALEENY